MGNKQKIPGKTPETRSEIRVLRDRDGYRCDNFHGELFAVKSEDGREGRKAKVEKNERTERGRERAGGGKRRIERESRVRRDGR